MKDRTRAGIHDRIYALADKLLKRTNACQDCILKNCHNEERDERCCYKCGHFEPGKGCTVQALYCKLWLCSPEHNRMRYRLTDRLRRLNAIAQHHGLLVARGSREETLEYGKRMKRDHWYIYELEYIYGFTRDEIQDVMRANNRLGKKRVREIWRRKQKEIPCVVTTA